MNESCRLDEKGDWWWDVHLPLLSRQAQDPHRTVTTPTNFPRLRLSRTKANLTQWHSCMAWREVWIALTGLLTAISSRTLRRLSCWLLNRAEWARWSVGKRGEVGRWQCCRRQQLGGGRTSTEYVGRCAGYRNINGGRSRVQWYVDECDARKFASCEGPKEGFEIARTTPRPNANGCPSGWMTDTGLSRCFKVGIDVV